MVYNTEQQIRDGCGMGTVVPTSAVIARWQVLIDALIDSCNPTPNESIAAIIELNRISVLYKSLTVKTDASTPVDKTAAIDPLTPAEEKLLLKEDCQVDCIPMNGKRYSEVY